MSGFAKKKKSPGMGGKSAGMGGGNRQQMMQQLAKMQEEMKKTEVEGSAGNGLVTITLNGEKEMKAISIKKDCVDPDDIEALQDLVKAAYDDATSKLSDQMPQMPPF